MNEQRRHPRVEQVAVVTYEDLSGGEEGSDRLNEMPCWLKDLSEGGALLQVESKLAPRTPLVLHFTLEDAGGGDTYLRVPGETRWLRAQDGGGPPFRVGVRFGDLSPEHRLVLREFLARKGGAQDGR